MKDPTRKTSRSSAICWSNYNSIVYVSMNFICHINFMCSLRIWR
jgi:hypothetical protein